MAARRPRPIPGQAGLFDTPARCGDSCAEPHYETLHLTAGEIAGGAAGGFGHPAEALVAELLDQAGVAWEYEPRCYPIRWDETGEAIRWFRPDLWLPDEGYHIEITVGGRNIINLKNRKLRALAEHHPEVNCRLFRRGDIAALQLKLGRRVDGFSDGVRLFATHKPQVRRLAGSGAHLPTQASA